jgi:ubiquitin carboxyl-terminal hydrolase 8
MVEPVHRDEEPRPAMKVVDEPTITAETLFNYLQGSSGLSVLLLDVRSREEFNHGTIYASSVVCIEPISLREGYVHLNIYVGATHHEQNVR